MADDINTNPFALGFFTSGTNLKLREKIALAQMMQKRAYPKTLGEGIASIGDSIYDVIAAKSLENADRAAQGIQVPPPVATPTRAEGSDDTEAEPPPLAQQVAPQVARPPIVPVPPPDGTPGNTGATTFQPPFQPPPPPLQPPPAPVGRSAAPPLPPAETAPAPPFGAGGRFDAAFPGRQSMAPPPLGAPVMAMGGDDEGALPTSPRNGVASALMQQQTGGGAMNAMAQIPPDIAPSNAISAAPPADLPIRVAQAGPPQPQSIPGYVPPQVADPQGAPIIGMSPREIQLRQWLSTNQGNPYAAAKADPELQTLAKERETRQNEANEIFKAKVSRATKGEELHQTGRMTQEERIQESARRATDLKYQEQKLREEGLKRRQELVGEGGDTSAPDPYLGTPQSRQRSGRPEIDPPPKGAIPEVWVKDQQAKIAKTAETLDSAKPELSEALNLLNKARAHPSKEASLGTLGGLARLTAGGQGFAAIMDQLKGKNFLAGYQKLKGTGNVSEIEGLKTEQAQARLATAQTKEDFDDALNDLESSMRGAVERVERKMKQPVTAYQTSPNDPYAPDLHQTGVRTINGKEVEVEYIGGDPKKNSSYKVLRR